MSIEEPETETIEEENENNGARSFWIANLILLCFSILLGLTIAEIAFRNSVSYEYLRVRYYRLANIFQSDPHNARFDSELGFITNPGLDVRFKNPPFDVRIQTNSMGFRDDEESIASSEYLFLGDSFVFGWGVEEEDSLVAHFEKKTSVTALNMGQSGYGNVQQYLLLGRSLPKIYREGQKVMVIVYDNDPADNCLPLYSAVPTVRKVSDEFVVTSPVEEMFVASQESQRPSFLKSISRVSLMADFLVNRIIPVQPHFLTDFDPRVADLVAENGRVATEEEGFRFCMNRFKEITETGGMDLHVFFTPPIHLYQGEKGSRLLLFDSVLTDLEISHFDLTPFLGRDDFYPIDGHWKPSGHRKVMEAIVGFLIRGGLIEHVPGG